MVGSLIALLGSEGDAVSRGLHTAVRLLLMVSHYFFPALSFRFVVIRQVHLILPYYPGPVIFPVCFIYPLPTIPITYIRNY